MIWLTVNGQKLKYFDREMLYVQIDMVFPVAKPMGKNRSKRSKLIAIGPMINRWLMKFPPT